MKINNLLKNCLGSVGSILGVSGVIFVALRLNSYAGQIKFSNLDLADYSILGLLVFTYGAANLLLARAWWNLLHFFNVESGWMWAVKTYGFSQLAKYVPGNIFHLASRQAIGMSSGVKALPLAKSALWEIGLIAVAGTLFGSLAVSIVWPELPFWIYLVTFLSMTGILFAILHHCFSPFLGTALLWQMIFLAISGMVFIGTLNIVKPGSVSSTNFLSLCGAYVVAWLVGLVTPGAPAGVGVREMVLLFLLGNQITQADLLLTVVFGRGETVLGDLFYFTISSFLKKRDLLIKP